MKRILCGLFLLFLLWAAVPHARAVTPVETDRACTLELTYAHNGQAFSGLEIRVYRAAEVFADGTYALQGAFAEYPVNIYGITQQSRWQQTASTLAAYAAADGLEPDRTAVTGEDGTAALETLQAGMYLVTGARAEDATGVYLFDPFMICLPSMEGDSFVYEVSARPKCASFTPALKMVEHRVVKHWKDTANAGERPSSVTVEILKDGQLHSTQTLSPENDWSYAWSAPDDGSVWQAVERNVPEGYTVAAVTAGDTILITNSRTAETQEPPKMGDTVTVWPYVLVMCISGTALVILAAGRRRFG